MFFTTVGYNAPYGKKGGKRDSECEPTKYYLLIKASVIWPYSVYIGPKYCLVLITGIHTSRK